jgi:hypothetical protein
MCRCDPYFDVRIGVSEETADRLSAVVVLEKAEREG